MSFRCDVPAERADYRGIDFYLLPDRHQSRDLNCGWRAPFDYARNVAAHFSWCDKNIGGGFGIMFDDVVAGLISLFCLVLLQYWFFPL